MWGCRGRLERDAAQGDLQPGVQRLKQLPRCSSFDRACLTGQNGLCAPAVEDKDGCAPIVHVGEGRKRAAQELVEQRPIAAHSKGTDAGKR